MPRAPEPAPVASLPTSSLADDEQISLGILVLSLLQVWLNWGFPRPWCGEPAHDDVRRARDRAAPQVSPTRRLRPSSSWRSSNCPVVQGAEPCTDGLEAGTNAAAGRSPAVEQRRRQ
ncbi:hypothetical protein ACCO45_004422 [Purpureocillium lilacinum]|uniref:Uncharacterized protein n=1 Tax=Purpureocillium lilacinum TaxID=33203 RepID=A0ACC4E2P0_PURLI